MFGKFHTMSLSPTKKLSALNLASFMKASGSQTLVAKS